MRLGKWRGVALALALSATCAAGRGTPARAGWFTCHTIPREVQAVDFNTGGPDVGSLKFTAGNFTTESLIPEPACTAALLFQLLTIRRRHPR